MQVERFVSLLSLSFLRETITAKFSPTIHLTLTTFGHDDCCWIRLSFFSAFVVTSWGWPPLSRVGSTRMTVSKMEAQSPPISRPGVDLNISDYM